MPNSDNSKPLTKKQKRTLDRIFENFSKYSAAPEGQETFRRLEEIANRIHGRQMTITLSENENRALAFIKTQIKGGNSPSIRDISRHLNFNSSRSGFKVVQGLLHHGLIRRSEHGHLELDNTSTSITC